MINATWDTPSNQLKGRSMLTMDVEGVTYTANAVGGEAECTGCAARGVERLCQVLNAGCSEQPQIWQCEPEDPERAVFEDACVKRFAHWRKAGNVSNDNGAPCTRASLCWKDDLGNYGVAALNAAWWGWQEGRKELL